MFVLTTKFNKRKFITIAAIVAALIVVILIAALSPSDTDVLSSAATVRSNEQRVTYLKSLGWEVENTPLEEQTVIIPKEFDGVYSDYVKLQSEQGFDLSKYAGMEATRYTYKVLNYPYDGDVVADIIVYRNRIIAGDIQSPSLDGFMIGLMKAGK